MAMAFFCVLIRMVTSPILTLQQKRLLRQKADSSLLLLTMYGGLALPGIVLLGRAVFAENLPAAPGFWSAMLALCLLDGAGNLLLLAALRETELSFWGPINAYKPVVSLVFAAILLREIPGRLAITGVLLTVAGSWFVSDPLSDKPSPKLNWSERHRSLLLRFTAIVLHVVVAVILQRCVQCATPGVTLGGWAVGGAIFSLLAYRLIGIRLPLPTQHGQRSSPWPYVILAVCFGLGQLGTVVALHHLPVVVVLTISQVSTLLITLLGYACFQERPRKQRWLGTLLMIGGAIVVCLSPT